MSVRLLVLGVASAVTACSASREPRYTPMDTPEARSDAETKLVALRDRLVPRGEAGYRIAAVMTEGRSGRTIASRGAVAVRPPDALRMQLVGPAGALALDVWIRGDRGRLAVPAMDRVEQIVGDEPAPGRPIAFLRWWMLHPLDGQLVSAWRDDAGGSRYLLRTPDGAEVDARIDAAERVFHVTRTSSADEEHLDATGPPCGSARYTSRNAHLTVNVTCEGPAPAPNARAFDDPDGAP